jgi:hypothetical protein
MFRNMMQHHHLLSSSTTHNLINKNKYNTNTVLTLCVRCAMLADCFHKNKYDIIGLTTHVSRE